MQQIKSILTVATIGLWTLAPAAFAQQTYKTDQGHSEIAFVWSHAGVSMQYGEFTQFDGTLTLDANQIDTASLEAEIAINSLHTGVAALDDVLMGPTWLAETDHPKAHFTSTSVTQTSPTTAEIHGELTLKGQTRPITLQATLLHQGAHPVGQFLDHFKGDWLAFNASATLDHQAFAIGDYSMGPITLEIRTQLKAQ